MSVTFEIDGKKLQSIKSAAKLTSYSRDYITRLAREQKIVASFIERKWFIDIESLHHKTFVFSFLTEMLLANFLFKGDDRLIVLK